MISATLLTPGIQLLSAPVGVIASSTQVQLLWSLLTTDSMIIQGCFFSLDHPLLAFAFLGCHLQRISLLISTFKTWRNNKGEVNFCSFCLTGNYFLCNIHYSKTEDWEWWTSGSWFIHHHKLVSADRDPRDTFVRLVRHLSCSSASVHLNRDSYYWRIRRRNYLFHRFSHILKNTEHLQTPRTISQCPWDSSKLPLSSSESYSVSLWPSHLYWWTNWIIEVCCIE